MTKEAGKFFLRKIGKNFPNLPNSSFVLWKFFIHEIQSKKTRTFQIFRKKRLDDIFYREENKISSKFTKFQFCLVEFCICIKERGKTLLITLPWNVTFGTPYVKERRQPHDRTSLLLFPWRSADSICNRAPRLVTAPLYLFYWLCSRELKNRNYVTQNVRRNRC